MLTLRIKRLTRVLLLLIYGNNVSADAMMQGWVLSDPDVKESANSIPQPHDTNVKPPVRKYTRTEAAYNIPDVQMLDRNGNEVTFREITDYGGPVMLQFIFTTCSTICPVLSASFASVKRELDKFADGRYRLVSISIDPEQDTPEQLNEYAERFKAGKNWYFLTGDRANVANIQKAFDATYAGNNKMYHKSLTFMRLGVDANWIRIEGLLSKNDMVNEFKGLIDPANR